MGRPLRLRLRYESTSVPFLNSRHQRRMGPTPGFCKWRLPAPPTVLSEETGSGRVSPRPPLLPAPHPACLPPHNPFLGVTRATPAPGLGRLLCSESPRMTSSPNCLSGPSEDDANPAATTLWARGGLGWQRGLSSTAQASSRAFQHSEYTDAFISVFLM